MQKMTRLRITIILVILFMSVLASIGVLTYYLVPYREENLAIINLQSYSAVDEYWIVDFHTTGFDDLTVAPINKTRFGVDIEFLELRGGNSKVDPHFNKTAVFYANWSFPKGRIVTKVLRPGKHTLMFRYGTDARCAYNQAAGWQIFEIKDPNSFSKQGVAIGCGRNDSTNRVYVTDRYSGYVLEFTWNGTGYNVLNMGRGSSIGWGSYEIGIGYGRNDSTNRIYVANDEGFIYEYSWNPTNGKYTIRKVARTLGSYFYGVAVGRGRNDNTWRIYAGDGFHRLMKEYAWDTANNNFTEFVMGPATVGQIYSVTLGYGRNDSTLRIYASDSSGSVYEYTWNATNRNYSFLNMSRLASGIAQQVKVARGRNDDTWRAYTVDFANGHPYEYTWNKTNKNYTIYDCGIYGGLTVRGTGLTIGDGRNDGITRIYVADNCGGYVFEYTWNPEHNNYTVQKLGRPPGYGLCYGIALGKGRNEANVNRIYVAESAAGTGPDVNEYYHFVTQPQE